MAGKKQTLKQRFDAQLQKFRKNPESVGFRFRLDLSKLIIKRLNEKKWSQKKLADRASLRESFVSRIINSNANCTFGSAGRLLFALGYRAGDIELVKRQTNEAKTVQTGPQDTKVFIQNVSLKGRFNVREEEGHWESASSIGTNPGGKTAIWDKARNPYKLGRSCENDTSRGFVDAHFILQLDSRNA